MNQSNIEINEEPYTDLQTLFSKLNKDFIDKITSVADIEAKLMRTERSDRSDSVFMGLLEPPQNANNGRLGRRSLNCNYFINMVLEITQRGFRRKIFRLVFHREAARTVSDAIARHNSNSQMLIIVKNALAQKRTSKPRMNEYSIEFHLGLSPQEDIRIFKVIDCTPTLVGRKKSAPPAYTYVTLSEAAAKLKQHSNFYAVVSQFIKEPSLTNAGSCYHGMYALVDPSCPGGGKTMDYLFHVMCSSPDKFPRAQAGDILRAHRAKAELRPVKAKADLRVFSERDVVVFPINNIENPISHAVKFTFTEEDKLLVKKLRDWALSNNFGPIPQCRLKMLAEIEAGEAFDLICQVSSFWDQGEYYTLWIEDGTVCPYYTLRNKDEGPINPQLTQEFFKNLDEVYLPCPKSFLEGIDLEVGMCLHIRGVQPVVTIEEGPAIQFGIDVHGAVEEVQKNTRYYEALQRRLGKAKAEKEAKKADGVPARTTSPVPVAALVSKEPQPVSSQSPLDFKEDSFDRFIGELPSTAFKNLTERLVGTGQIVLEENAKLSQNSNDKIAVVLPLTPEAICTYNSHANFRSRELTDSSVPAFAPPVTSTQNNFGSEDILETNAQEIEISPVENIKVPELPSRKRAAEEPDQEGTEKRTRFELLKSPDSFSSDLFEPGSTPDMETNSLPVTRHRANNEEVELRRIIDKSSTQSHESQFSASEVEPGVKVEILEDVVINKEEIEILERPASPPVERMDSIIILEPCTQPDLNELLAPAKSRQIPFVKSLADLKETDTENLWRIRSRIEDFSPSNPGVEDLLCGFCTSCHCMWDYRHFKNLRTVFQPKFKPQAVENEALPENRVVNFLCSRADHAEWLENAAELTSVEEELDAVVDYKYKIDFVDSFLCPACKANGIPDNGCRIIPSFCLQLRLSDANDNITVIAAGIHAEYFLGFKADTVIRSSEAWKQMGQRLTSFSGTSSEAPLFDLLVRRIQHCSSVEYHLENTFVVYEKSHILPF